MANSINATSTGNGGIITTGDDSGVLNIQTNETTAISIDASQNATFTNGANLPNTFGFKNRIINGGMTIDQRNAGASVTPTTSGTYTIDRWVAGLSQASKFSVQQSSVAPSGFSNSLLITSLSAYTVGSSETFLFAQYIEGFNVADLGWGASGASTVTLSFWVRSSLTGTFGGALLNNAQDRSYPFSYTISAANTWEQKTVTVAGDTTGTWLKNSSSGIKLILSLGTGSTLSGTAGAWAGAQYLSATGATSVVGTSGATFYITGVQLEKGTQATSFDFRSIGTELALCQRYYYQAKAGSDSYCQFGLGRAYSGTAGNGIIPFAVPMRSSPTFAYLGTVSNYDFSPTSINSGAVDAGYTHMTVGMGFTSITSGSIYIIGQNAASTPCGFTFSAEL